MSKIMKIRMPEDQGLLYKSFHYPAGEIQTRLTPLGVEALDHAEEYEIVVHNVPDVVELAQLADALNGHKLLHNRRLFLQYLPYGRADRRFTKGDSHGLGVFIKILATMAFTSIWTFDVHNEEETSKLMRWTGQTFANMKPTHDPIDQINPVLTRMAKTSGIELKDMAIVFPDKGAAKRYGPGTFRVPVLQGDKKRDEVTGGLRGFHIDPAVANFKAALIIDDICDGGGTFVGLAEEIRKINPNIFLALYVSHGIFSKGMEPLEKVFNWVYTSDYSFHQVGDDLGEEFKTGAE